MAEKKFSKIITPILLLAAISVLSFFMNKYRFSARHFVFPAALFILPILFDRTFRPKKIFLPSKEGLKLFLWVTLATLVFYPPLFFAYNLGFMHRALADSTSKELLNAVTKGLIAIAVAAIPEEFFFRGYIQEHVFSAFDKKILKIVSLKNLFTSLLFGLVHALAFLDITRAATFFPSLLFGLFTEKSKGRIFYSISYHVVSNILAFILWTFIK
ncbi:CPBP family intramembrane metalloprotease [bacterium]|nr:CPBP family intramembrane metalloprotease [bacterium]